MSDSTNRVVSEAQLLTTLHAFTSLGELRRLAQGPQNEALKVNIDDQVVPADPEMASRFDDYRWSYDKVVPDEDKVTNAKVMKHLLDKIALDGPEHAKALREIPLTNGSKTATPDQRALAGRYVTRAVVGELHDRLAELLLKAKDGKVPQKPAPGPQNDSFEHDKL